MKVLVTGRHGQVARSLIEAGRREGVEVIAAGRPDFDLRNADSVAEGIARHRPDVVVNAAAYTQVDNAEADEAEAYAVNADGAACVAQACTSRDIPLIHLSTDFVFDGCKDLPYTEADRTGPVNAYGRTKLEGERRVAAICPMHLIVRTSWVYSPWGNNFALTMLRLARDREVVAVVDDQHGNPTYAPHLADALLVLAQRVVRAPDSVRWGTYHAAGQGETTWCGFAREIFHCASAQRLPSAQAASISTADYPTKAKRPQNSRLDCRALQSAFAVVLPDWQTGVEACVARVANDRRAAPQPGIS